MPLVVLTPRLDLGTELADRPSTTPSASAAAAVILAKDVLVRPMARRPVAPTG